MTDDDIGLEQALRDGFADRTADLEIPSDMGARGRRIAQRRSARRVGVVAVPAIVVAVVAAVLLAGGGSGAPRGINASDVVRHVRAQLVQISRTGGVLETVSTSAGQDMHGWYYVDPTTHTTYDLMRYTNRQGTLTYEYWNVGRQVGRQTKNTTLTINISSGTWSVGHALARTEHSSKPDIESTARQIGRALTRGTVTYQGRVTLGGRAAFELRLPSTGHRRTELYVDPHTYRPIEEIQTGRVKGHTVTDVLHLRPATPANIAQARRRPTIPHGLRQLHPATTALSAAAARSARSRIRAVTCGLIASPASPPGRLLEASSFTNNVPGAADTVATEYTDPKSHVRYVLVQQFGSIGSQASYTSWEADTPASGGRRSVQRVVVNPIARTYSDQTTIEAEPAAPLFGIQSTAGQVRRALRDGTATRERTMTVPSGRKVLELKLPADRTERDVILDVDPRTDAPVELTSAYTAGHQKIGYSAYYAAARAKVVTQVTTRPRAPRGYAKETRTAGRGVRSVTGRAR